jgi:hypothetical protein
VKPGLLVGILTLTLTTLGCVIGFSVKAGVLENRVQTIESEMPAMRADVKKILDSVARIEVRMDDAEERERMAKGRGGDHQ